MWKTARAERKALHEMELCDLDALWEEVSGEGRSVVTPFAAHDVAALVN